MRGVRNKKAEDEKWKEKIENFKSLKKILAKMDPKMPSYFALYATIGQLEFELIISSKSQEGWMIDRLFENKKAKK